MLNSVFQHVKSIVDGLRLPAQDLPLTAHIVPPPMEPLGSKPTAYITLAGKMANKRQTMPRGPGFTELLWPVGITVFFEDLASDTNLEQAFYLVSDAILMALWAAKMPRKIRDPTTGTETQLLAIGEECGVQMGNVVTTANGRTMLFRGQVTTSVREATQTGRYLTGGRA